MQQRAGARHVIYAYIPTLSVISLLLLIVEFAEFYILSFSITDDQKHYYNCRNYPVFKCVSNDVGMGPLVLEIKIHHQRLCTLSKRVMIWHPFIILFMIFNFKDDLLFIRIVKIIKQIACEHELITYCNLKGFWQSNTSYSSNACPAFSARPW